MRTSTKELGLALTSLTVLVLSLVAVVALCPAIPVLADGPTTVTLPGGSLTTALGYYKSAVHAYPHKWDVTKG